MAAERPSEAMLRTLTPLVLKGNSYAAGAMWRILMAEDADAEVERIIEDWQPVFARLAALGEQLIAAGLIDIMGPN